MTPIAPGEMKEIANVQIEVVLAADAAKTLLARIEEEMFPLYRMIALESDLRVLRVGKF